MNKRQKLNMDELLTKIVSCLVRHSPKELSFSRISQLTKVPRSTLYYYFGNKREKIIDEAIRFGMKAFVQLYKFEEDIKHSSWEEFQFKRLMRGAQIVERYPWVPHLYIRYRNDLSQFGQSIREIEDKYCEKLSQAWQKYQGNCPDIRNLRLSCYLKIGLCYGLAADPGLWFSEKNENSLKKMLKEVTALITLTLKLKI